MAWLLCEACHPSYLRRQEKKTAVLVSSGLSSSAISALLAKCTAWKYDSFIRFYSSVLAPVACVHTRACVSSRACVSHGSRQPPSLARAKTATGAPRSCHGGAQCVFVECSMFFLDCKMLHYFITLKSQLGNSKYKNIFSFCVRVFGAIIWKMIKGLSIVLLHIDAVVTLLSQKLCQVPSLEHSL